MISLTLDAETDRRLADLASVTGRSPQELLREALDAYLEDLEDLTAADAELERIEHGEGYSVTLDELKQRLGLDG